MSIVSVVWFGLVREHSTVSGMVVVVLNTKLFLNYLLIMESRKDGTEQNVWDR